MFKELAAMAGMMKNLPKIQASMSEFQAKLGEMSAEGSAGGDMAVVRVNGRMEVTSIHLSPDLLSDRELAEDLIRSATNQALAVMRQRVGAETSKLAEGMGMPAGMNLPGLMG